MQSNINKMPKRYERLFEKAKMTPKNGTVQDASCQPRMPWHDLQCCIEGPSVYDLSQNFIRRWNSVALNFERSFARYRDPVTLTRATYLLANHRIGGARLNLHLGQLTQAGVAEDLALPYVDAAVALAAHN